MAVYRRNSQPRPAGKPGEKQPFHQPMFVLIVFLIIFGISYIIYRQGDEQALPPGPFISDHPHMVSAADVPSFVVKGITIEPVASYSIRGRVLVAAFYTSDEDLILSPAGFLLGWGPMSDTVVLDKMRFKFNNRKIRIFTNKNTSAWTYTIAHASLLHVMPANDSVARLIMKVRKNNIVQMSGYLVNLNVPPGWRWKSSGVSDDENSISWGLFWVDHIVIEP